MIRIVDIARDHRFEAARLRVREDQTALYPCPVVGWIADVARLFELRPH